MPYYFNTVNSGLILASSLGDGYSINLHWNRAFPKIKTNKIAYHIYYSTDQDKVFSEGVKFISIDGVLQTDIYDLDAGQLYHWAVRAMEYNPILFNYSILPTTFNNLKVYPTSVLVNNITETSNIIPLLSTEDFPNSGTIQIGVELINYTSNDKINNYLNLTNISLQRGYNNTFARFHNTDGYDGYHTWSTVVSLFPGTEEKNTIVFPCQSRFDYPNFSFNIVDGYKQVLKDILTTDLSGSDAFNTGFPAFDHSGWRRVDPVLLLNGECVGSYFGGQQYCADGYNGVGGQLRGLSLQERNNQRQEELLSLTGEPVVLVKKVWTGVVCACYEPDNEYSDDRCPKCFGTKFVLGWEQYFNPRRSDGRIMVRFSQTDDDVKTYEAGFESEMLADVWTLTVPTIKDRDFIVRFDQDGNEEFRYEVLSVNRNKTITQFQGAQKFRVQRVRKTDVIYQVPVFRDTKYIPKTIETTVANAIGLGAHKHTLTINENSLSTMKQLTGIAAGHNHEILFSDGKLITSEVLGHKHEIIIS